MALVKISALTELTSVANDDKIPIVDSSAGETKYIQQSNLLRGGKVLVSSGTATCSSTLTTSTTAADITGCTTGSLSLVSGDLVEIIGVFDMLENTTNVVTIGILVINGAEETPQALHKGVDSGDRGTVSQVWQYSVPTTTTYTFKLQGKHNTGATGSSIYDVHTRIIWKVFR